MKIPFLKPVNKEEEKEKISLKMYDIVLAVRDTVSLPTHKTLFTTFIYSIALFVVVLTCQIFQFYTFLSWQGCLACCLVLGTLLFIERNRNREMQSLYRAGRKYLEHVDTKKIKGAVKAIVVGKERR